MLDSYYLTVDETTLAKKEAFTGSLGIHFLKALHTENNIIFFSTKIEEKLIFVVPFLAKTFRL
jgi:hypothetical protein